MTSIKYCRQMATWHQDSVFRNLRGCIVLFEGSSFRKASAQQFYRNLPILEHHIEQRQTCLRLPSEIPTAPVSGRFSDTKPTW